MTTLIDFVSRGKIGHLSIGLTKEETLKLLGAPSDWLGRPPNIGFQCDSYEQSDVWFYYNGGAGVRFGGANAAFETLVYPEKTENCPELFGQWPIRTNTNLGTWRAALLSNKIPFQESDPESLNYWIVAEETCVAFGLPFKEGRKLHGYERTVELIGKFSSVQDMMRECKFLSM